MKNRRDGECERMKNKLVHTSLFGFAGVAGYFLNSKQLMGFFLFFLLLLLIPVKVGGDFKERIQKVIRNSFIFSLAAFSTVFFFTAILVKTPMIMERSQFDILLLVLIHALSWCFVLTIGIFVFQVILAALLSAKKNG